MKYSEDKMFSILNPLRRLLESEKPSDVFKVIEPHEFNELEGSVMFTLGRKKNGEFEGIKCPIEIVGNHSYFTSIEIDAIVMTCNILFNRR